MRKKLFAILMSAMMMVTFMPAMAFAATPVPATDVWFSHYDDTYDNAVCLKADRTTEVSVETSRTFDANSGGIRVGVADTAKYTVHGERYAYYYDLDCITLNQDSTFTAATYATSFSGKTVEYNGTESLICKTPAFIGKTGSQNELYGKSWIVNGLNNYSITVKFPEYDVYSYADQTFTVTPQIAFVGSENDGWNVDDSKIATPNTIGTLAPFTFTVKAAKPSVYNAEFFFDKVSTTTELSDGLAYDGAEHTIIMRDIPGATVSYKVLNRSTGKYEAVEKVVLKDVDKKYDGIVDVKALVEMGTKGTYNYRSKEYSLLPQVTPAKSFTYGLDEDLDGKKVAKDFNEADLMTVTCSADATKADKAAVAANEELLKAYFNDCYKVVKTPAKLDENKVTVSIVNTYNDLTGPEKAVIDKKYEQLEANFVDINVDTTTTIVVYVDGGDIEWVKAPLTKKYYNKKGTLKKTYTFQVEAKADAKVTYTLKNGGEMIKIDKNTGKVTVKKGLKLGTYTVYVTASAGKNAKDTYALTIKMAKKK